MHSISTRAPTKQQLPTQPMIDSNNLQIRQPTQLPPDHGSLLPPYETPSPYFVAKLRELVNDETLSETAKDQVKEALEMAPTISIMDAGALEEMRGRAVTFSRLIDEIDTFLDESHRRRNNVLLFRTELVRLRRTLSFGVRPGSRHRSELAGLLQNLTLALHDKKRDSEACTIDEEALAIRRECFDVDPDAQRFHLADMLSSYALHLVAVMRYEEALGACDEELRQFSDAKASQEEALVLRRILYEKDPEAYRSALEESLRSYIISVRNLSSAEIGATEAERDNLLSRTA
ncbi:hypothetical protein DL93DRAFT_2174515 [Clavulina sp. PMI_390]|nr:hypothetical protein DL93DRAFT_2174515 [Clavulina sp. PMI_390]